ncbi:class I SAM-dependent methyltransferase [Streptomyces sp. BE20]|uniref:class I SAM-dependent methyltransferase n=1 Tax=Streptomycetaceae TaxID=2062 RepID=UPI002E784FD1|nr:MULTISPECIES: class I SAM-dependent methyltransferase [unclassified Streptomyces]MED7955001.1 class I SAM-dependent methyltransferase [Streptomyces sp. BE303]MEE1828010.1 class I SAM-dependent methyltransferase [Streptomyces sp. BE20]
MSNDRIPASVRQTYGPDDLSRAASFAGGFINFGDWRGIDTTAPTPEDRVLSQENLYRRVLRAFPAPAESLRLAEVGCGRGLGAALALREFRFARVTGVDIHPDQVERARAVNARALATFPDRLGYTLGSADELPFADGSLDGVYSVEAAQHFRELTGFARETARVLRPGGRLVVTTFFSAEGPEAAERLSILLGSFADGLDVAHPLDAFTADLADAGFTRIATGSIGEDVWPGLDRYLEGTVPSGHWTRNFLTTWRDGLLDYHVVTAERS